MKNEYSIRISIILVLFVLCNVNTKAQTNKTIIIDTVVGYTSEMQFHDLIVQSVPEKGKELIANLNFQPKIIVSNEYPNVVVTELNIDAVALLLDDKGGVLKLLSIDNIPGDTIKIDKWVVYENGLSDTIHGNKFFFQMYNDSMAKKPYKTERILSIKKNHGCRNVNSIDVKINNTLHKVPVDVITVRPLLLSSFQGHLSKKKYKKFLMKNVNDKTVYRYQVFMGEKGTYSQRYDAELEL